MLPQVLGATRRRPGSGPATAATTRANAGAPHQVGAGRLLPLVRAGLEGDDQRRPASPVPRRLQRHRLGVTVTELGVIALADHFAVAEDHSTHQRIRRHASPALPRQLDGPRHRVRLGHAHSA